MKLIIIIAVLSVLGLSSFLLIIDSMKMVEFEKHEKLRQVKWNFIGKFVLILFYIFL